MKGELKADLVERGFRSLTIDEWRQFDGVQLDFDERLTIITGANGAGKTTLLNILATGLGWEIPFASVPAPLRGLAVAGAAAATFLTSVWSRLTQGPSETGASAETEQRCGEIVYASGASANIMVPSYAFSHRYNVRLQNERPVQGLYIPSHRPVFVPIDAVAQNNRIDFAQAFNAYSSAVKSAWMDTRASTTPPVQILKETLLTWAATGDDKNVAAFESTLRDVLPSSIGFMFLSVRSNEVILECDTGEYTFDAVSGGIAAVIDIAWQVFLYARRQEVIGRFVVLIDEPENHLHPEMQRSVLFKLINHFLSAQFIVASHAPLVVTSVQGSKVYALSFALPGTASKRDAARGKPKLAADPPLSLPRRVHVIEIRDFERAGTANDILRGVLGLDYTMPVWAANILDVAANDVAVNDFSEDALSKFDRTLRENKLERYAPEALKNLNDRSRKKTPDPGPMA
ncbi:MAG: AAA family ATPase [Vulcanimicrobiaceae bacterium]|jgi:predicted ATPase